MADDIGSALDFVISIHSSKILEEDQENIVHVFYFDKFADIFKVKNMNDRLFRVPVRYSPTDIKDVVSENVLTSFNAKKRDEVLVCIEVLKTTSSGNKAVFTKAISKKELEKNRKIITVTSVDINTISGCCFCGKKTGLKKCSGCNMAPYCSRECQKAHWGAHKQQCLIVSKKITGN